MNLDGKHCIHGAPALDAATIAALLPQVPGWAVEDGKLKRNFAFRDYHETIEFVNALAWMIHAENHHPDLRVSYRHCVVAWTTHSAGNTVSLNDIICAAKADAIYEERTRA
jgi:4a-hydroxytetrahydrobiopterin dehydratase